jgi:hypothetical protein
MFEFSDIPDSPWHVVDADDKYCARLNVIMHLLKSVPYEDLTLEPIELPPRQKAGKYARSPIDSQKWIPRIYPGALSREEKLGSETADGAEAGAEGDDQAPGWPEAGRGPKGKKRSKKKK